MKSKLRENNFLTLAPFNAEDLRRILEESIHLKQGGHKGFKPLKDKALALIMEKPSTRTRVSFEVAISELGGTSLVLGTEELQMGRRESVEDTGKVLSRYVDGIIMRTSDHERLVAITKSTSVPVINGLSDICHPCQAIADVLTITEYKGGVAGQKVAYVGDGNNVAQSLMRAVGKLGGEMVVATPKGYEPLAEVVEEVSGYCETSGGSMKLENDPQKAVKDADVIYTDVWAYMGQESERSKRLKDFQLYQVNEELLERAHPDVMVMHCLPAHRGEEITSEVLDGTHSAVWDQAENRLHAQMGLLSLIYS